MSRKTHSFKWRTGPNHSCNNAPKGYLSCSSCTKTTNDATVHRRMPKVTKQSHHALSRLFRRAHDNLIAMAQIVGTAPNHQPLTVQELKGKNHFQELKGIHRYTPKWEKKSCYQQNQATRTTKNAIIHGRSPGSTRILI